MNLLTICGAIKYCTTENIVIKQKIHLSNNYYYTMFKSISINNNKMFIEGNKNTKTIKEVHKSEAINLNDTLPGITHSISGYSSGIFSR